MNTENAPSYAGTDQIASQIMAEIQEKEEARKREQTRSQYINFGILTAVLLVIVLVVGLSAPFISQRLVAAFMGDYLPSASLMPESSEEIKEPQAEEMTTGVDTESPADADNETAPAGETTGGTQNEQADTPAPEPLTYQVQAGDTLFSIARQYNVTTDALIKANNITTPNNIPVGMVLVIPQP